MPPIPPKAYAVPPNTLCVRATFLVCDGGMAGHATRNIVVQTRNGLASNTCISLKNSIQAPSAQPIIDSAAKPRKRRSLIFKIAIMSVLRRTAVQAISKPFLPKPRSVTAISPSSILRSMRVTVALPLQRRHYNDQAERGERSAGERTFTINREDSVAPPRPHRRLDGSELPPTRQLYVANLLYDVTKEDLRTEMEEFGEVVSSKIIMQNDISRGYGYVEFKELDDATRARTELNGKVFGGRQIIVNYVLKVHKEQTPSRPTKTIFIGNIPFEMTDEDLNKLFGQLENCIDVRVAVDRKTGVPRGFAHADFLDVPSAETAMAMLKGKEVCGRALRVDYSDSTANARAEAFGRRRRAVKGVDEESQAE
ncbi:MAG: hypothetical protein M1839_009486 [Geoglossum umbratile]|nr:MAG: hypothetical protein M1839_009486 [Geoglossum umbratile]